MFDFVFSLLAKTGAPFLRTATRALRPLAETLTDWLTNPTVHYVFAALLTVASVYGIGLLASVVVGRRLIAWMERLLTPLPLVQAIYGATKRSLQTLRQPPATGQRVLLISFPTPERQ